MSATKYKFGARSSMNVWDLPVRVYMSAASLIFEGGALDLRSKVGSHKGIGATTMGVIVQPRPQNICN